MDKTKDFYNQNAKQFFDSTYNLDMTSFYNRFLKLIPQNGHVLDAGCGSGRDSKYFKDSGFKVSAFDISEELCTKASNLLEQTVECKSFQDLEDQEIYDGIWCCASILHVPPNELKGVFSRLLNALKNEGVLYASFKYGDFTGERNGRVFTDLTENSLRKILETLNCNEEESWITSDIRPGRESEKWLNVILKKK